MTTINYKQDRQFDLAHEERLQRCAELGQVVPINKPRARQHCEAMAAQVQAQSNK